MRRRKNRVLPIYARPVTPPRSLRAPLVLLGVGLGLGLGVAPAQAAPLSPTASPAASSTPTSRAPTYATSTPTAPVTTTPTTRPPTTRTPTAGTRTPTPTPARTYRPPTATPSPSTTAPVATPALPIGTAAPDAIQAAESSAAGNSAADPLARIELGLLGGAALLGVAGGTGLWLTRGSKRD